MTLTLPAWFEITSIIVILAVLLGDLLIVIRRPHLPRPRECALWVSFYVALALVFAALLWWVSDATYAGEFVAGWLTEYSLSIDNLFVFVLIMARFSVPRKYQQEVLMVGIIIALVLRAIFILFGATLIASFSWIFYIFGAWLLWTAYSQAFRQNHDEPTKESAPIRFLRSRLNIVDTFDGMRLRTTIDGSRVFTPLILVLIALGTTDLLFALDSIPAIFGITQSPFIVFTANVFALMGLRQLYFLLGHLVETLVYLKYGIAAILAFIGLKLVFHAMHENQLSFINGGNSIEWAPSIDTAASLVFIVVAMSVATLASLVAQRYRDRSVTQPTRSDIAEDDPT